MAVWAIADLHLSFGVPNKSMNIFGEGWREHPEKIEKTWKELIAPDDLVLLAGDISWSKHLEDTLPDLNWIHNLPGTKVMIRGNHDYWWASLSKLGKILPSSIHLIQNNVYNWRDCSIGGARMWDTPEYNFDEYVLFVKNDRVKPLTEKDNDPVQAEKVFMRELVRLEMSLKQLDQKASHRIIMTHYPPIGPDLKPSRISALLEKYRVDICVFGHIHNLRHDKGTLFGEKNGVHYYMTAADFLGLTPLRIL